MNCRLYPLLLIMAVCLLAGCSKPRIELAVASQPNVNPDNSGRPSPVIVKMFELRNDLAFKQSDFHSLFNQPMQALGSDLIAADELVFIPGEARVVRYLPTEQTRFIGIMAGFRQMDRSLWRVIRPVDPEETNLVAFELNDVTILLIPDKEVDDWDPEVAVKAYQQRAQSESVSQPDPIQQQAMETSGEPVAAKGAATPITEPPPSDNEGTIFRIPAMRTAD